MFNTRQNNNTNKISVNTKLYTSYSDTCSLTVGGWNTNLSVKFAPFKGVDANGFRQYAQDSTEIAITSLTVDNTTALLEGIKNKIYPAIENKENTSVSVSIGDGNNRKVLGVITENEDVYLRLTVGVSDAGIAGENSSITHKFNKKEYITNYDPSNGGGEVVNTNADFINFVKKLEDIYSFSGASSHCMRYSEALKTSFSNNRNAYSNTTSSNTYTAPTTNIQNDDMSGFLPFN